MKKFIFVIFIYSFLAQAQIPANDPGMALLGAYSCDSVGNKTAEQLSSIKSLESAVAAIQNDENCRYLANQINALPSMDSILENLRQSNIAEAIRKEESVINQALADLQEVEEGKISEDDQYLYPDPDILRATIQNSRTQLVTLKAQLSADKLIAERESYVNGIDQLSQLGQSISGLVRNPDDACLDKHPGVKASMASSLFGISGFFMNQPLGIATNLAGKLLQNIFNVASDLKRAKKNKNAFEGIRNVNLISGLSCSLESLAGQSCRLNREHDIFQKLVKQKAKNTQELEENLGSLMGNACLSKAILLPNLSEESIGPLVDWVRESQNLGIGLVGDQAMQDRKQALSSFISGYSQYDTKISGINNKLRSFTNEETKKIERLKNVISEFAKSNDDYNTPNILRVSSSMNESSSSMFESNLAKQVLSDDDHRKLFLRLISNPDLSSQQITDQYQKLKNEYENDVQQRRSEFERGKPIPVVPSQRMLAEILEGKDIIKSLENGELPETTKSLVLALMDENVVTNNQINLAKLKQNISESLSGANTQERKDQLVLKFFGNDGSNLSPYENLEKMKVYIDNLPPLPKHRAAFLRTNELKKTINDVIESANKLLDDQTNNGSADWGSLISKMNNFVGSNNNISQKIANINKELDGHYANQLNKKVKSLPIEKRKQFNDALFMLNMDNLKSAIKVSMTPADQHYDYVNAKALNKAHLNGFQSFFQEHIKTALDESSKNSPYMKQKLCISLLSLPTVDENTKKACGGITLKSLTGEAEIEFNKMLNMDHEKRACAYQDFKMREYYSIKNN